MPYRDMLRKKQSALFRVEKLPPSSRKNFAIQVVVSDDNMTASVKVITTAEDCGLKELHILNRLYRSGIRGDFDYDRMERIVKEKRYNEEIIVARGFRPTDGDDAQLVAQIELEEFTTAEMAKNFPGQRIRSGVEVSLDQPLVIKESATKGISGLTVRGRTLPARPGKDIEFEAGANVTVSEDGLTLLAAQPGLAGMVGGKVEVRDADYDEWKYQVQFRQDKMEAVLAIIPGITDQPEHDEQFFKDLLSQHDIKFGVEHMLHRRVPAKIKSTTVIRLAAGEPPDRGADAKLEELFRENTSGDDRFFYVRKDQLIVKKKPADKGGKGRNVLDEPVPAPPGADIELIGGENTRMSEDGLELFAEIDGVISVTKGKYNVVECVELLPESGQLKRRQDHPGMIKIAGNLPAGYSLIAGHHVEITGDMEASNITAGGMISVSGGVKNCGKGRVQAGTDINAGFVENSRLVAGGNINLEGPATNSILIAGGEVTHSGRERGIVKGGRMVASGRISFDEFGSPRADQTSIEAGMPLVLRNRYEQVGREVAELARKRQYVAKELELVTQRIKGGAKTAENMSRFKKMKFILEMLNGRIRLRTEKMKKLTGAVIESSKRSSINARKGVYPGVILKIGPATLKVDSRRDGKLYKLDNSNKIIEMKQ